MGRVDEAPPHSLSPAPLTRNALLVMEPSDRQRSLESYCRAQVATVLGCPVSQLDLQQPLSRLGIDSLMVIQLKHRIETDLGATMHIVEFLQCPNLAELATKVLNRLTVIEALKSNDLEVGENCKQLLSSPTRTRTTIVLAISLDISDCYECSISLLY